MQTFLPYQDFMKCAEVLDNKRLGKQRVEAYQILLCLETPNRWKNHPAVLMWKGYSAKLYTYLLSMCCEWVNRGFNDSILKKAERFAQTPYFLNPIPDFLGNEKFHASHRSNLLRKNFNHYSQFGWKEDSNLPYYWPTKEINGQQLQKSVA